jgi:hypothetical protein
MRRAVLTVRLGLGAGVVLALPAQASARAVATGTFSIIADTLTPVRTTAIGTTFYSGVLTGHYSCDLSGRFADTDTFVMRADGSFQGHGTEACTGCTLAGQVGHFTATLHLQGSAAGTPTVEWVATSLSPAVLVASRVWLAKELSPGLLNTRTPNRSRPD